MYLCIYSSYYLPNTTLPSKESKDGLDFATNNPKFGRAQENRELVPFSITTPILNTFRTYLEQYKTYVN